MARRAQVIKIKPAPPKTKTVIARSKRTPARTPLLCRELGLPKQTEQALAGVDKKSRLARDGSVLKNFMSRVFLIF